METSSIVLALLLASVAGVIGYAGLLVILTILDGRRPAAPTTINLTVNTGDMRRVELGAGMVEQVRRAIGAPERVDAADWRVIDEGQPCITGREQGAPATLDRDARRLTAGSCAPTTWSPSLRHREEMVHHDK